MTRAKMPIVSGAGSSGDPHHQFGFSFDQRRCTGCKTCEMACRDYHDLGTGPAFRTVHEYAGGPWIQNDEGAWEHDVFAFYVSMSCNHCTNPVCLRFCASDAIAKDDFGFVRVDAARCTGCQVCALSCPYHAPRFSEASAHIEKCDGCFDRVAAGLGPICVEACPQRALDFGIYDDIADHPLMVERVATMPDPVITQPNYAIEPCEAALRAADAVALQNLGEI